jgi:molybdate transport repressor ModE-like protein
MLDVRRLRVLREVARQGSFSAAARELHYTQPAVSHQIARLEDEVGTPLLVRGARSVRLTDAGAALVAHADAVLARLEAAEEDLAQLLGLRAGRVRLAAFPSAAAALVPPAVAALRARAPEVEVSLVEAEPPEALAMLGAGDVDLALVFAYPEADDEPPGGIALETVDLITDDLVAVLPAGHELAAGEGPVELAELAGATWIAGCVRCRSHLLHASAEAGFVPRIAYETDDHVTVQALIAHGLGVALLPELALRSAQRDDVRIRPLARRATRTVSAVLPATGGRSPAVEAFLGAVAEAT